MVSPIVTPVMSTVSFIIRAESSVLIQPGEKIKTNLHLLEKINLISFILR